MNTEACINCRFSRPTPNAEVLLLACRRHAPRALIIEIQDDPEQDSVFFADWPLVADDEWCGEYVETSKVENTERNKMN